MTNQEIVQRLWNECNVLRDDGITYQDYVTELTYILFLKMSKEQGQEEGIPVQYRWDELKAKEGLELKNFYKQMLLDLGMPKRHRTRKSMPSIKMRRPVLMNRPIWKKSSRILMNSIGSLPEKKGWATCMKGCWRRTPTKPSPVRASISRRVRSST